MKNYRLLAVMSCVSGVFDIAVAVVVGLFAAQVANAQSVSSEPDFSGMYMPSGPLGATSWSESGTVVARDSVRGWNYIARVNYGNVRSLINGVQVGNLSRVSDSGILDLGWIANDIRTPQRVFVLTNGDLLGFDGGWQRVRQNAGGTAQAEPFQWTASGDCPGSFGNSVPAARDRVGNVYAFINCFAVNTPATYRVRRVLSSGELDLSWRLDIATSPSQITRLTVADDGSVFYVAATPGLPFSDVPAKATLHRASANDALRWSREVAGGVAAIAADSVGRPYVLSNATSVAAATLIRIDAAGSADAAWTPAISVADLGDQPALRVLGDRLLVAAWSTRAGFRAGATMLSLTDGSVRASRAVADGAALVRIEDDGTLIESDLTSITLVTPRENFVERRIAVMMGSTPTIAGIVRWGDGYVVGGQFEYWYDGIRYANLMRLTAALKPDPTWQPAISGTVNALAKDRDGGLLVGGNNLLGAQTSLLRLAADGQLDARWIRRFEGTVSTIAAAADGLVFVGGNFGMIDGIHRAWIARFDASGLLQTTWPQSPAWCPSGATLPCYLRGGAVTRIIDVGDGGVLVFWRRAMGVELDDTPYRSRFSRTPDGVSVALSNALNNIFDVAAIAQDPATGRIYGVHSALDPVTQRGVNHLLRLLPVTLEIDPLWTPLTGSPHVAGFSESHMYLTNGRRLTRQANTVIDDLYWTLGRTDVAGWLPAATNERGLLWPTRGVPLAVRTTTQVIAPKTVVEYYSSAAQRYFMTARPSEQQQLDALPAQFVRTGMLFTAFDGAVVPPSGTVIEEAIPQPTFSPAGAVPVCRFYASPERGGSNTHFYGRGTDCQFLNTVAQVINEGYDFAAQPTKNGACPTNTPIPVYRLFNNQSASNNVNHRYVVSLARLNEMKVRGWLDEGIAFCTASAVDASGSGG